MTKRPVLLFAALLLAGSAHALELHPINPKASLSGGVTGVLPVANGGTGLSALGSANKVLGVDAAGTAAEYKTIAGTANRLTVTHSPGAVTLALPAGFISDVSDWNASLCAAGQTVRKNTGGTAWECTAPVGTTNQITVTQGTGTVTYSLPQNIHTAATPTFAGLTLSGLTSGRVPFASTGGLIADDADFAFDSTTDVFSGPTAIRPDDGAVGTPAYAFSGDSTSGFYRTSGAMHVAISGSARFSWNGSDWRVRSDGTFGFASGTNPASNSLDTFFAREGAANFQLGADSATPVAPTISAPDASASSAANGASLILEAGRGDGAGNSGEIQFKTNTAGAAPTARWAVSAAGNLYPITDNASNLGGTVNRVATAYIGTQVAIASSASAEIDVTGNTAFELRSDGTMTFRVDTGNDGTETWGWRNGANSLAMQLTEAGALDSLATVDVTTAFKKSGVSGASATCTSAPTALTIAGGIITAVTCT